MRQVCVTTLQSERRVTDTGLPGVYFVAFFAGDRRVKTRHPAAISPRSRHANGILPRPVLP